MGGATCSRPQVAHFRLLPADSARRSRCRCSSISRLDWLGREGLTVGPYSGVGGTKSRRRCSSSRLTCSRSSSVSESPLVRRSIAVSDLTGFAVGSSLAGSGSGVGSPFQGLADKPTRATKAMQTYAAMRAAAPKLAGRTRSAPFLPLENGTGGGSETPSRSS